MKRKERGTEGKDLNQITEDIAEKRENDRQPYLTIRYNDGELNRTALLFCSKARKKWFQDVLCDFEKEGYFTEIYGDLEGIETTCGEIQLSKDAARLLLSLAKKYEITVIDLKSTTWNSMEMPEIGAKTMTISSIMTFFNTEFGYEGDNQWEEHMVNLIRHEENSGEKLFLQACLEFRYICRDHTRNIKGGRRSDTEVSRRELMCEKTMAFLKSYDWDQVSEKDFLKTVYRRSSLLNDIDFGVVLGGICTNEIKLSDLQNNM